MPPQSADPISDRPAGQVSSAGDGGEARVHADSAALDEAVIRLAAQAAFLQSFAEHVIEEERPVEEFASRERGGEIDFGWRAGLHW